MKALFGMTFPLIIAFPFLVFANTAGAAIVEKVSPDRQALILKLNKAERAQAKLGERLSIDNDLSSASGEVKRLKGIRAIVKLDEATDLQVKQRVRLAAITNDDSLDFESEVNASSSNLGLGRVYTRIGFVSIDGFADDPLVFGAGYEKMVRENISVGGSVDYWSIEEGDFESVEFSMTSFSGYGRYSHQIDSFRAGAQLGLAYHRATFSAGGLSFSDSDVSLDFGLNAEFDLQDNISTSVGLLLRSYEAVDITQLYVGLGMTL